MKVSTLADRYDRHRGKPTAGRRNLKGRAEQYAAGRKHSLPGCRPACTFAGMPYTIEVTAEISAPVARVWRALTNPDEVVRWDTTVDASLDAPVDYPQPGQHVRWRCRNTTELLHDRPLVVEPGRRLQALLEFDRQRMDETYTLTPTDGATVLSLRVELTVRARFLAGPILLHVVDGPAARRAAEASMTNLKYYCELATG
jgi:uncharacterized protein YndB with AHSA1/START domain